MGMAQLELVKVLPSVPSRPIDAHKGTFGTVIVLGGCSTMVGAPALCAGAALRSGVGLVKVAVPATILQAVIAIEPSATGIALSDDVDSAMTLLAQADPDQRAVLAVGPGWGNDAQRSTLLEMILLGKRTVVLDADGLNMLSMSRRPRPQPGPPLIMTPHPGEFRKLAVAIGITERPTEPADRSHAAARLATAHKAVVVLKGRGTVVCDGNRCYVNTSGNPALATAGTGDVLTGTIASLCAQGLGPFDAAVLGVHLHGFAADLWSAEHGPSGLTARDLADRLPDAFEQYRSG